ncbi:hypothetical protein NL529_27295, partial [Klebsiella pneumoniae]|nr:hypothetical protein [Klebsiella pneumoniae]
MPSAQKPKRGRVNAQRHSTNGQYIKVNPTQLTTSVASIPAPVTITPSTLTTSSNHFAPPIASNVIPFVVPTHVTSLSPEDVANQVFALIILCSDKPVSDFEFKVRHANFSKHYQASIESHIKSYLASCPVDPQCQSYKMHDELIVSCL